MNIYQAAAQHHAALAVADLTKAELIDVMRKCNSDGMSIVELARISGFSRPTVMKYVQDAATATMEPNVRGGTGERFPPCPETISKTGKVCG